MCMHQPFFYRWPSRLCAMKAADYFSDFCQSQGVVLVLTSGTELNIREALFGQVQINHGWRDVS